MKILLLIKLLLITKVLLTIIKIERKGRKHMVLFEIENIGEFMNSLFTKEWLDLMELVEAEITTFYHIKVDGRQRLEWYDGQEAAETKEQGEFIVWRSFKHHAYQLIKGKRVPQLFRLVLRLPKDQTKRILEMTKGELLWEDVQGLYLNIKYEKKQLSVVTGLSLRRFSLDKSLEQIWDEEVGTILKKQGFISVRGFSD